MKHEPTRKKKPTTTYQLSTQCTLLSCGGRKDEMNVMASVVECTYYITHTLGWFKWIFFSGHHCV
jgi:hypothetical protein